MNPPSKLTLIPLNLINTTIHFTEISGKTTAHLLERHEDSCSFSAAWAYRCCWPLGLWGRDHLLACHLSSARTRIWSLQTQPSVQRWSETEKQKQLKRCFSFYKQRIEGPSYNTWTVHLNPNDAFVTVLG